MEILINVPDDRADPIKELLGYIPYIEIESTSRTKPELMKGLKEAIGQVKEHIKGTIELEEAPTLLR